MLKRTLLFLVFSHSLNAADKKLPLPLQLIENQGGEIVDSFSAPSGITGYLVDFRGNAVSVYVSADKNYLFTGKMLDAKGRDMGNEALENYIRGPLSEKKWQTLLSSNWISDGNQTAEKVIYTFTDPNCPYCKKFWENVRPWVDSGDVQVRHILVGILKADSYGKSAAILSAKDPAKALLEHESGVNGAIRPLDSPSKKVQEALDENHLLMKTLGISGTPAIYYKDKTNTVKLHMGLPSASQLKQIISSKGD